MATLLQSLQDRDIGFLRILAEQWGLSLPTGSAADWSAHLAHAMLDETLVGEVVGSLSDPTRRALEYLLTRGGRAPVADITRRFGAFPEIGPGRRDREKAWRNPSNPVEDLWYRGLVARAYEDTATGLVEFAYVPSDLAQRIPAISPPAEPIRTESTPEPSRTSAATLAIVDDADTSLAFFRLPLTPRQRASESTRRGLRAFLYQPEALDLVVALLADQGTLTGDPLRPAPQPARAFLAAPRAEAWAGLVNSWKRSTSWNDLANVPHLEAAGARWPNDPLIGRSAILGALSSIPAGEWRPIESIVHKLKGEDPAFQRPGGDFEAWYLSDSRTGAYLRGFENWDLVEGELIRYLITGPLHWLGVVDLGITGAGSTEIAFRLADRARILWDPQAIRVSPEVEASARLGPDGRLQVPRSASRTLRYQVSRFAAWEARTDQGYSYLLTPSALDRGARQGLRMHHIRGALQAICGKTLPPPIHKALERWEKRGTEARIRHAWVLLVTEPRILAELRASRTTARYLTDDFGTGAVRIRERDWEALRAAAARLGILIDAPVRVEEVRKPEGKP